MEKGGEFYRELRKSGTITEAETPVVLFPDFLSSP
jgi:hypothetical protein